MKWNEVSAGIIHGATQRLWTALDDDADRVATQINGDPDFLNRLVAIAKSGAQIQVGTTAVATASAVTDKFGLLVDLGEIVVPDDYVHATQLATFRKKNKKKFYYYNDDITDENFANPTRILKPGDKFRVRAFRQLVGGTTTSDERMAFLKSQNAILVGAQGSSLVFDQKHTQLPKGLWYASFDEKERLWKDAGGDHRVPGVLARSDGAFHFDLGRFEGVWRGGCAFFCFCE